MSHSVAINNVSQYWPLCTAPSLFDETVRLKESIRFDTKSFRYKSFPYELKQ